jgi:multiple RNA-binding domain-containing protein 1
MQAARAAFHGLAYKRFHHVPLYLEYAPRDVFDAPAPTASPRLGGTPEVIPGATSGSAVTGIAAADAEDENSESVTLFVKNVSFSTSADALKSFFGKCAATCGGKLRAVRMVMGKRPDGKQAPKGFAFAELSDRDTARAVLKKMQGTVLDGHPLELQLSIKKRLVGHGEDMVRCALVCMCVVHWSRDEGPIAAATHAA